MSAPRTIYVWLPELAGRWGITERTLYRWLDKGQIADTGIPLPYSRVGRRYGWTESQIADIEAAMIRADILAGPAA